MERELVILVNICIIRKIIWKIGILLIFLQIMYYLFLSVFLQGSLVLLFSVNCLYCFSLAFSRRFIAFDIGCIVRVDKCETNALF